MSSQPKPRIRLLIADDQILFRQMMVETLAEEQDLEVVGEATNGEEAINLCRQLAPDIALVDINMPRVDGLAATKEIVKSCATKVVVLTAFDDDQLAQQLIQAGATSYVLKDSHSTEVIQAIRLAHSNESMVNGRVLKRLLAEHVRMMEKQQGQKAPPEAQNRLAPLTEREREVLQQLGMGRNNKEICDALFISEPTVKTHVTNIMQKMHFRDRVEAVLFAVQYKELL
jgi:DNA-binding NarL/FixJ family response regulator